MDKKSNEHVTCMLCDEDAVHGTDPPLCARHAEERRTNAAGQDKTASAHAPETLKELEHA